MQLGLAGADLLVGEAAQEVVDAVRQQPMSIKEVSCVLNSSVSGAGQL
jgi:hypothetical protein